MDVDARERDVTVDARERDVTGGRTAAAMTDTKGVAETDMDEKTSGDVMAGNAGRQLAEMGRQTGPPVSIVRRLTRIIFTKTVRR